MGSVGNLTMESSRKGFEGVGESARDPNHVTQHQVGAGGVFGGSTAITTARQCRDRSPTGNEVDREDAYALHCGLQVMRYRGREQAPGRYFHRLEREDRMAG